MMVDTSITIPGAESLRQDCRGICQNTKSGGFPQEAVILLFILSCYLLDNSLLRLLNMIRIDKGINKTAEWIT